MVHSSFVELSSPTFHPIRSIADLVRLRITQADLACGRVAPLVDQLMQLSDNLDGVVCWKGRLFIGIEKARDETRDASEVKAIVHYLRQLAGQWPFWLHFAEKEFCTMAAVLRLLTGTERMHLSDSCEDRVLTNADGVRAQSKWLYTQMKHLYRFHGFPESDDLAMAIELTQVVNTMFLKH